MRRGSLIAPLLLILIGTVFLIKNIRPELPLFETLVSYWPFLLIGWGLLRLVEVVVWYMRGKALPSAGVGGGEWALIIVMTVVGSSIWGAQKFTSAGLGRLRIGGVEVFGEAYDFPLPEKSVRAGKTARVVLENLRGNARIVGADAEAVTVKGRTSVRAMDRGSAEKANAQAPLEATATGEVILVRTNQDRVGGDHRVSSDLEITIPRGATLECRGRYGDWDITDVNGEININSDNAGVRVQNAGGNVRLDTRKSDILRVIDAKGDVEIKGGGRDIELENIAGLAVINGSFSGETTLRKLAKGVRFESSVTQFRVERIPGEVQITLGQLAGDNLTGPLVLDTKSKDVRLTDVANSLEIRLERGDVELRQLKTSLGKTTVDVRSGDIELAVPPSAGFLLTASTDRGRVTNDFSPKLKETEEGQGAKLTGSAAAGPEIRLTTRRGGVTVRKIGAEDTWPPAGKPAIPAEAPEAPPAPPATKAPKAPKVLTPPAKAIGQ
jgi:DUF4097 and DUF4098 domain-containing protein YvlB